MQPAPHTERLNQRDGPVRQASAQLFADPCRVRDDRAGGVRVRRDRESACLCPRPYGHYHLRARSRTSVGRISARQASVGHYHGPGSHPVGLRSP